MIAAYWAACTQIPRSVTPVKYFDIHRHHDPRGSLCVGLRGHCGGSRRTRAKVTLRASPELVVQHTAWRRRHAGEFCSCIDSIRLIWRRDITDSPMSRPTLYFLASQPLDACRTSLVFARRMSNTTLPFSVRTTVPCCPIRSSEAHHHTGAPFDTGTSYRPGARFGPSGIRQGSRRLNL